MTTDSKLFILSFGFANLRLLNISFDKNALKTVITVTKMFYDGNRIRLVFVVDCRWYANFDPGQDERDEEISKLAEREHSTAEYQAECSANITQQSKQRVPFFRLDVRVLHLREKYLHSQTSESLVCS